MSLQDAFGALNPVDVDAGIRAVVAAGIAALHAHPIPEEIREKREGGHTSKTTKADQASQTACLEEIQRRFPHCGVIAEEDHLRIPSKNGITFVVDPLDGTSSYVNQDSDGVSVMVAMVHEETNEVPVAWIANAATGEWTGFGLDGNVQRRRPPNPPRHLLSLPRRSLAKQRVILRDPLPLYQPAVQQIIGLTEDRLFGGHIVCTNGIGVSMSRLFFGAAGGAVLKPIPQEPWDIVPVIAIAKRLGFRLYDLEASYLAHAPVASSLGISLETQRPTSTTLFIHGSNEPKLAARL